MLGCGNLDASLVLCSMLLISQTADTELYSNNLLMNIIRYGVFIHIMKSKGQLSRLKIKGLIYVYESYVEAISYRHNQTVAIDNQ